MHLRRLPAAVAALLFTLTGCHSAFIDADVVNSTARPITLVELDYPSASFGIQTLAPGQDYKYRFKVLGSGALKLLYTDADHHDHTIPGPLLKEGDEGSLSVTLTPAGVSWTPPIRR